MNTLLIGSSFSAVPMLFDLKQRGQTVTVIGKYKTDPCHSYADDSIFEDYSDKNILLNICLEKKFDYIVPSCNDYSYVAAAFVADRLGLPGFDNLETTAILHEKHHFRKFCTTLRIPVPTIYGEVSPRQPTLNVDITTPVLVKPVDSFSGRGVRLVRNVSSLPSAIQDSLQVSRQKRAIVEEFVDGSLHSHTGFISNGVFLWHDFVDEYCEVYRYQVDRSKYPSTLPEKIRQRVHHTIARIVYELKLCDGLLHTQFMSAGDDYWIIECMRRCPGDLYGHHFSFALDYNYESQYVASFIREKPAAPKTVTAPRSIERRVISTSKQTALFALNFEMSSGRSYYIPLKNSGEKVDAAPFDKIGILFNVGKAGDNVNHPVRVIKYDMRNPA